jgi:tetratricopeptide (TPR) repeat protein
MLNALRGVALVGLVMGRIPEGCKMGERTVKEFNASSEAEQMAARSAGQDAGAASLAVLSWALWLFGSVDDAVGRIAAALQRADAVKDPHTQAYVSYYASVLYALRNEPAVAHRHAERCLILSEDHGFRQWRGLSRGVCSATLEPSQAIVGLEEYRSAGYQFGITALLILLCKALLLRRQLDAVSEIVEQGLSTCSANSERFFEAELYRLKAQQLLFANKTDSAQSFLERALTTARTQCSRSLELRAARDLAGLLRDQGKPQQARDLLAPVYGRFTEGFDTLDLKEAKALLGELAG